MNYGYNPTHKDELLATKLQEMLSSFPPDEYGMHPYIERNGLYPGVRIRRITHYSKKMIDELVKKADAIFDSVVKKDDLILPPRENYPKGYQSFK